MTALGRSKGIFAVTLAAAIAFAILLSLGFWQLRRLEWKESLLADIAERMSAVPKPIDEILADPAHADYRKASASGQFFHDGERHFFATHDARSGYYIYTPLEIAPLEFLFVNRGFVPFDRKDPASRREGQPERPVTVIGLARAVLAEKPSSLVPDNDPAGNVFYWKDIAAMQASAGLPANAKVLPLFLDADAAPNPGGLPIGGVTILQLPNSHLSYAWTWFGLAGALAAVWAVFIRQRLRPARP